MPAPISNYEKSQDAAARAFLRYDQSAMIRKFDLAHDADALYITFVDRPHRVDRHTGLVTLLPTGEKADYNAAMTIYDLLCDSKPLCQPLNFDRRAAGEEDRFNCSKIIHRYSISFFRTLFRRRRKCFSG